MRFLCHFFRPLARLTRTASFLPTQRLASYPSLAKRHSPYSSLSLCDHEEIEEELFEQEPSAARSETDSRIQSAISLLSTRDTIPTSDQLLEIIADLSGITKANRILQLVRSLFLHLSSSYPFLLQDSVVYEKLLLICLNNMSSRECQISFVHLLSLLQVPLNEPAESLDMGQSISSVFAPVFVRIMLDMNRRLGITPIHLPSVIELIMIRMSFYRTSSILLAPYLEPLMNAGLSQASFDQCVLSCLFQMRRISHPSLPEFFELASKKSLLSSKCHSSLFFYHLDRHRSDPSNTHHRKSASNISDLMLSLYPKNEEMIIDIFKGFLFLSNVPEFREYSIQKTIEIKNHYLKHFPSHESKILSVALFLVSRIKPLDDRLSAFVEDHVLVKDPLTGFMKPKDPSYYSYLLFIYYPDIYKLRRFFHSAASDQLLQDRRFLYNLVRAYTLGINNPQYDFVNAYLFSLLGIGPHIIPKPDTLASIVSKLHSNLGRIVQFMHDQGVPINSSTFLHIIKACFVFKRFNLVVNITDYSYKHDLLDVLITGNSFGFIALALLWHNEWATLVNVIRYARNSKFPVHISQKISYAQMLFDDFPRISRIMSRSSESNEHGTRIYSDRETISTLLDHINQASPSLYQYWTSEGRFNGSALLIQDPVAKNTKPPALIHTIGELRSWIAAKLPYVPLLSPSFAYRAHNNAAALSDGDSDWVRNYLFPLAKWIQLPEVLMEHHTAMKRSLFANSDH